MKNVIVFGGSGFLGSYITNELVSRKYNVIVADKVKPLNFNSNIKFINIDILDNDTLKIAIPKKVDIIYNFAGEADLDYASDHPLETLKSNILGNLHILECCKSNKINRFVYASSAYSVSNKGGFYGISKLTSEKIIEEYNKKYGINFTIIRYGSLYGEGADFRNGIYSILFQAIQTKRIDHYGDGEEMREYIHAKDAAKLSVDIIEDDTFFNQHVLLTGIERYKYKEVLTMIKEIMGDQIEINFLKKGIEGHYKVTPYSFEPIIAKKLVANPYIDMGQGLIQCLKAIHKELHE